MRLDPSDAYASCGGDYKVEDGTIMPWAPDRFVFKHVSEDIILFYAKGSGLTEGWACGYRDLRSNVLFSKYQ